MMMLCVCVCVCVCVTVRACVFRPIDSRARASEHATEKKKCDSMRYKNLFLVTAIWIDQKAAFFLIFVCEK